ncbi:splicing factor 3B subunit 4, partial [Tremellales sp. Uapishka_1]
MQAKSEQDRNQEATVYLGNLDEKCTDALVWELMLQAGPVSNVFLPKDRISMAHQGFGFCEFLSEADADYAVKIMNQIKLWGKPIRVNKASYDQKQLDVGANLFIGGLESIVDENTLFDTFNTFGTVSEHPKIARDPTTGESKGYGFVSYHDFEAADMAIENMNGQFLANKPISVQYAFKKDGKGERHGTPAERLLAAQAKYVFGVYHSGCTLTNLDPRKQSIIPGAATAAPGYPTGYQGQFAGVLAAQTAQPPQPSMQYPPQGYAPPPPGIPVYQPPMPSYPGYDQQQNGYPSAPPPPAGFPVANGSYPPQGPPPPPIRMGFPNPQQ